MLCQGENLERQKGSRLPTYDTALEAVSRSAQKNLLLLDFLLGRHLSTLFGRVGTGKSGEEEVVLRGARSSTPNKSRTCCAA